MISCIYKVVQKRCISFLWFGHLVPSLQGTDISATCFHHGLEVAWAGHRVITRFNYPTFVDPNSFIDFSIDLSIVLEGGFWFCLHLRRCVFRGGNPPLIRAANGISGHLRCCTEPDQRHLQKFHPATSAPVKSSDAWRLSCGVSLASWILRASSKRIQTAVTGIALGKYTDQIMDQLDMVKICEIQKEKHL